MLGALRLRRAGHERRQQRAPVRPRMPCAPTSCRGRAREWTASAAIFAGWLRRATLLTSGPSGPLYAG